MSKRLVVICTETASTQRKCYMVDRENQSQLTCHVHPLLCTMHEPMDVCSTLYKLTIMIIVIMLTSEHTHQVSCISGSTILVQYCTHMHHHHHHHHRHHHHPHHHHHHVTHPYPITHISVKITHHNERNWYYWLSLKCITHPTHTDIAHSWIIVVVRETDACPMAPINHRIAPITLQNTYIHWAPITLQNTYHTSEHLSHSRTPITLQNTYYTGHLSHWAPITLQNTYNTLHLSYSRTPIILCTYHTPEHL